MPAVARPASIPSALRRRPFRSDTAIAAGLITRRQLQSAEWSNLYPGVFAHRDLVLDYATRCRAALLFVNGRGVLGGVSAAYFWGADLRPHGSNVVEVTISGRTGPKSRPGLAVVTSPTDRGDLGRVAGVPVTSAARTAFDLARRSPFVEAMIAVDALVHAAPYCLPDLHRLVAQRHWPGTSGLPAVLAVADEGSESPMETRARLILVGGGLPRPVTQYTVIDQHGRTVARLDLAYREHKVGALGL